MRSCTVLLCLITVCAFFCAGCSSPGTHHTPAVEPSPSIPETPVTPASGDSSMMPTTTPQQGGITIDASPERYSPYMSSTVGIQLTPHYETSAAFIYNWTTDYGYFVAWNATDGKVTLLNQSIETEEQSIYWSYSPDDMGMEKPPVTVRLVIQMTRMVHGGGEGRGTIAWKDIHITWEDTDTAIVEI